MSFGMEGLRHGSTSTLSQPACRLLSLRMEINQPLMLSQLNMGACPLVWRDSGMDQPLLLVSLPAGSCPSEWRSTNPLCLVSLIWAHVLWYGGTQAWINLYS